MRVELDIFSGRPNPRWSLTEQDAGEFLRRLRGLPKVEGPSKVHDVLGYRGLLVLGQGTSTPDFDEIRVGQGTVACRRGDVVETYADVDRAVERWLVETGQGNFDRELYKEISRELCDK